MPPSQASSSSPLLDFLLLSTLSVVFVVTYVTHMYVVEVYLARADTHFHFMALKYCFGCLHLVLLPLAIIALKPDIRYPSFWREIQLLSWLIDEVYYWNFVTC